MSRDEIGPVWNKKDCMDKTLQPVVKGGETLALQQLQKTVSARPDWTASFESQRHHAQKYQNIQQLSLSPFLSLGCLHLVPHGMQLLMLIDVHHPRLLVPSLL